MRHLALLYRDPAEYAAGVGSFVQDGLDAGEPVMVAVPGDRLEPLRARFGASVRFVDMMGLGRNPGRIIPAVAEWLRLEGGGPARFVGEPIWDGRSAVETLEATRHEALLNLAFGAADVEILCPYDALRLDAAVLGDAERTHPLIAYDGEEHACARYADPETVYAAADHPLARPHEPVARLDIGPDVGAVRSFVGALAARAGLIGVRHSDLLLAANEAAANTLVHGDGRGVVSVWREPGGLVCEVADGGSIGDPLVGRRTPGLRNEHGRGLWMMHQLCDLVELRSGAGGTTLRLHMSLS
jgi:anti-sigma regulatory factor (Ser/Thr protein kinase)